MSESQETLFDMDTLATVEPKPVLSGRVQIKSRMRPSDSDIIREAIPEFVEKNCYELLDINDTLELDADELEKFYDDIEEAVDGSWRRSDGYEIAKYLEDRCGWECSSTTVEALESFSMYKDKAERRLIRAWSEGYNIQPKYKLDDIVTFKYRDKATVGKIVKIDTTRCKYYVNILTTNSEIEKHTEGYIANIIDYEIVEENI